MHRTKVEYKMYKRRQAGLNYNILRDGLLHVIIICIIFMVAIITSEDALDLRAKQIEVKTEKLQADKQNRKQILVAEAEDSIDAATIEQEQEQEQESDFPLFQYSKVWDEHDNELLARIVECEAGTESLECKEKVCMVILNRVFDSRFPNTIEDVIFQCSKTGIPQFAPTIDGSWEKKLPSDDSYKAVDNIRLAKYDSSQGALYFDSVPSCYRWHEENLQFLYQVDNVRFYK